MRRLAALLPEVPTAIERGYQGVEFYLWVALFAPGKMPEDLSRAIRRDIGRAIADADFVSIMGKLGAPVDYRGGPAFVEFLDQDAARTSTAIRRIGKVE